MKKLYAKIFKNVFTVIVTILISTFSVIGVISAATTIGTDITSGAGIFSTSLAVATTTSPYIFNVSGKGYLTGDLVVGGIGGFIGGANFNSITTTDSACFKLPS